MKCPLRPSIVILLLILAPQAAVIHQSSAQSVGAEGFWDNRFYAPQFETITHVHAVDPEHVYVTGRVGLVAGTDAEGIARWDGDSWHNLGSGVEGTVYDMVATKDGTLYVGGDIERAGDVTGTNLVKWNGSKWEAAAQYTGYVHTIAVREDGVICAGYQVGGSSGYSGDNVNCFGRGAPPKVEGMSAVIRLIAGEGETVYAWGAPAGFESGFLAVWDGSRWIRDTPERLRNVGYAAGKLYAVVLTDDSRAKIVTREQDGWVEGPVLPIQPNQTAGDPTQRPFYVSDLVDGQPVIYELLDDHWELVGDSLTRGGYVRQISLDGDGRLYVVGDFQHERRPGVANFAWIEDGSWGSPSFGLGLTFPSVAFAAGPGGCIYAGGDFDLAGPTRVSGFACWDGHVWRHPGAAAPLFVTSMERAPDGTLYVIGRTPGDEKAGSRVYMLSDTGWSVIPENGELPEDGFSPYKLAIGPDGTLYAAGRPPATDPTARFGIARYDDEAWTYIGSGGEERLHVVTDMEVDVDGRLIVAGEFRFIGNTEATALASWDGSQWRHFGSGPTGQGERLRIWSLAVAGDTLYVGGGFDAIDGVPAKNLAYHVDGRWYAIGGGTSGRVEAIEPLHTGGLLVGGAFDWTATTREWASPTRVDNIALWKNGRWHSLDGGVTRSTRYGRPFVRSLLAASDGSVFVGGHFLRAGDVQSYNIARWIPSADPDPAKGVAPFPNPARDVVHVATPGAPEATVVVFDVIGRERARFEFDLLTNRTEFIEIPLRHLESGVYLLQVRTSEAILTYSVVVIV